MAHLKFPLRLNDVGNTMKRELLLMWYISKRASRSIKLAFVLAAGMGILTWFVVFHDAHEVVAASLLLERSTPTPLAAEYNNQSPTTTSNASFQELTGFYFYIDPAHGGPSEPGAIGPRGTLEKNWNLQIGLALGDILGGQRGHGAYVYYSRTSDETVSLYDRVYGPIRSGNRGGNNTLYNFNHQGNPNNWRLISIQLNGAGDTNTNYTSTWYRYQTPNQQSIELAQASCLVRP